MKEWFIKYLWLFVGGIALSLIVMLEVTSWRPLGYISKHEEVNRIILTVSYSLFASCLFYMFNDLIPSYRRNNTAKKYIRKELFKVGEQLRLLVDINPFSFCKTKLSREKFVQEFANLDLSEKSHFDTSKTKYQILIDKKQYIEQICKYLLSSYAPYMNQKQLELIISILGSKFIVDTIRIRDFSIEKEFIYSYPNNQEEIGESIFDLYFLFKQSANVG